MNERIRELADQAGITTNLDTDYFEKDINKWVDYYSEKFAELIIADCLKMCLTSVGNKDYNTGRMHCHDNIKEHFGIES